MAGLALVAEMATAKEGVKVVRLLRRAWNEIPEVVGSSVLAAIGVGFGFYAFFKQRDPSYAKKEFKKEYVVYRHDDPRAHNLKYTKVEL
ncbi:NADH:ubiquinone oxidoreductase subunit A3 [Tachypleus tridentatus]|uniref:NADH:ubiquinone oxidoreductase subunit A3 n=1 Tax=Tachypleus tridentatus TaxID=6853 RepID=UPI003FD52C66